MGCLEPAEAHDRFDWRIGEGDERRSIPESDPHVNGLSRLVQDAIGPQIDLDGRPELYGKAKESRIIALSRSQLDV
jgi:hypothetical protein